MWGGEGGAEQRCTTYIHMCVYIYMYIWGHIDCIGVPFLELRAQGYDAGPFERRGGPNILATHWLKTSQMPSNTDREALNRGALGGLGTYAQFELPISLCSQVCFFEAYDSVAIVGIWDHDIN